MIRRTLVAVLALAVFGAGYLLGSGTAGTTLAMPGGQAGCQTFRETGKSVCGRFLSYWLQNGGLAQQGFPLSAEFVEVSDLNGKPYTVQYFERAVFEFHPENQPPYDVLLSQLGTFRYRQKYGSNPPGQATPPPAAATATPAGAIFADVGELVRRNGMLFQVVRVDFLAKRVDVIYRLKNETNAPVAVTLANSDQRLLDNVGGSYSQADPDRVSTLTLAGGQEFGTGTTFHADLTGKGVKELTFAIDSVPRVGNVRVRIPLGETP